MRINEVEQQVGITKKNIRFYEDEGLLTPSRNAENGYRDYSAEDVQMLQKIRLLRKLSVPIEDIRRLQTGAETLQNCMARQAVSLEKDAENSLQIKEVCGQLAREHESFARLDVEACEAMVTEREKTGTRFHSAKNDIGRRLAGPVVVTVLLTLMMLGTEALLWWLRARIGMPVALCLVLGLCPIVVCGGIVGALWMRWRELKGGEEDEAAQY